MDRLAQHITDRINRGRFHHDRFPRREGCDRSIRGGGGRFDCRRARLGAGRSVVVVLVCAKASGAINAQARLSLGFVSPAALRRLVRRVRRARLD
jgi:hypothetical protein